MNSLGSREDISLDQLFSFTVSENIMEGTLANLSIILHDDEEIEFTQSFEVLIGSPIVFVNQTFEEEEEINNDKVIKCIDKVKLTKLINKSGKSINMIVGERGTKLSGGERQRLGIARALYKDPVILVLDEATSSLDYETENEIVNSIVNIKGKQTIIIVAHRLSTVQICDRVLLMENGKIKDVGDLSKLLKKYPDIKGEGII